MPDAILCFLCEFYEQGCQPGLHALLCLICFRFLPCVILELCVFVYTTESNKINVLFQINGKHSLHSFSPSLSQVRVVAVKCQFQTLQNPSYQLSDFISTWLLDLLNIFLPFLTVFGFEKDSSVIAFVFALT